MSSSLSIPIKLEGDYVEVTYEKTTSLYTGKTLIKVGKLLRYLGHKNVTPQYETYYDLSMESQNIVRKAISKAFPDATIQFTRD